MTPALMNWSGGKDSALALWRLQQTRQYTIETLLTTFNETDRRVATHGVREALIDAQALRLGLPQTKLFLPENCPTERYQQAVAATVQPWVEAGTTHAVFGDLFLEDLRQWRETQLARQAMTGVFPLWKVASLALLDEFWAAGFRAIVVSVNSDYLDASFCGRVLDRQFVADLPPTVDPCGENGEFHTFVYTGPCFSESVPFQVGEASSQTYHFRDATNMALRTTYFFVDLLVV